MKLGKSSWPLFIMVLLVIAIIIFGRVYLQKLDEQAQLTEQLAQAERRLTGINMGPVTTQKRQLEEQVSQLNAQIDISRLKLSLPIDSITVNTVLRSVAETSQVKITGVTSTSPSSSNLEGVAVTTLTIDMGVEGALNSLMNFVVELGNRFPTGMVKSVEYSIPEPPGEGKPPLPASAKISLVIYLYQGKYK